MDNHQMIETRKWGVDLNSGVISQTAENKDWVSLQPGEAFQRLFIAGVWKGGVISIVVMIIEMQKNKKGLKGNQDVEVYSILWMVAWRE